ncbi:MAG: hypothetical protein WCF65_10030 [Parachlamydiaceae bacterium]
MNIQSFLDSVVTAAQNSYVKGKAAAIWCGHNISVVTNDHIIPAVKTLCSLALASFRSFQVYAKDNLGAALTISSLCVVAGMGAFEMANNDKTDGLVRALWKVVGVAAFICAAGTAGASIAVLA